MRLPRGDGDGWTRCRLGHRHWGLFGAAGLLLWHVDDDAVLLQHRAWWSHHGGTWGIPGGARNSGESAEAAAGREAGEEVGVDPDGYAVLGTHVDDHGDWAYTTVVARGRDGVAPAVRSAETVAVAWVPAAEVPARRLHPGFAGTWELVRTLR